MDQLLAVASGQAEGYCEAHLNAWGAFAAISMIVEAGGPFSCDPLESFLTHASRVLACGIRARRELASNLRNLALFNVAIDSKLRGCDLVKLAIADLVNAPTPPACVDGLAFTQNVR